MRAADLFEQNVIPAEVARQVGVSHQIVSEWYGVAGGWARGSACGRASRTTAEAER
jgi:hypothetical protein